MITFLVFLVCLLSGISACEIQKLSSDPVKELQFDNGLNTHVISIRNSTHVVTVLDHENRLIREIETSGPVEKSYLIKDKDEQVHFIVTEPTAKSFANKESCRATLYKYSNSSVTSTIYDKLACRGAKIFIDKSNTMFINTIEGVSLIKSDENYTITVENLKDYTFYYYIEDPNGNVFLGSNERNSIFVITKRQKMTDKPYAYASKILDQPNALINKFVNTNDNYVVVVYNNENSKAEIRQLLPDRTNFYPVNQSWYNSHFRTTKTSFFYASVDVNHDNDTFLNYRYKEGFHSVNLKTELNRKREIFEADSKDNVFIANYAELLYVRFDRNAFLNPTVKKMPNNETIDALAIDRDDNIWILANNLYKFSRDSKTLEQKSDTSFKGIGNFLPILSIKNATQSTQQLSIGANSGLYTCTIINEQKTVSDEDD